MDTKQLSASEYHKSPEIKTVSVGNLVLQRNGHEPDQWQLALVQRDAVWDEVRMARLLDSLLAGYPIGVLLLCQVSEGSSVLQPSDKGRVAIPAGEKVTQLLDGQQRVNALVCLFSNTDDFHFFIDMTSERTDKIVTSRRDKRTTLSYILPSRDGQFPGDLSVRSSFLDLSRFEAWARAIGDEEAIKRKTADIDETPTGFITVIREIDQDFAEILPEDKMSIAKERIRRLIDIWCSYLIPAQLLHLTSPNDVLQVFTRINLEGVRVGGEDVFFAGVKTLWPKAEKTIYDTQTRLPLLSRLGVLRVLSRLASVMVEQKDILPVRVDRLYGKSGRSLIEKMEGLSLNSVELKRMSLVTKALIKESELGHGLRYVDSQLFDHVLAWAAMNEQLEDEGFLRIAQSELCAYLVGATAYRYLKVFRDTYSQLAFREALAAGRIGEPFPLERIASATRRKWSRMRYGQRTVEVGVLNVKDNARLFLSILQSIPFEHPPERRVEWDHIYAQALAEKMKRRVKDGNSKRPRIHPGREYVWHGGNLWALDASLNNHCSAKWPSEKLSLLSALPDSSQNLPALWPEERFLTNEEKTSLITAEELLRQGHIDNGVEIFKSFVESREERIRGAIHQLFPRIELFAPDSSVDLFYEDRKIPEI